MKRLTLPILALALAPSMFGCGGGTSAGEPPLAQHDLPLGWETAALLTGLTQAACGGSSISAPPEAIDATVAGATIHVGYHNARFRCEEAVQGFARYAADEVDLLVQPIDMNPATVARCDCTYEIAIDLPASHATHVGVYRRGDHVGGADDAPVLVGTASAGAR